MSDTLIIVYKTGAAATSLVLNTEEMLPEIRKTLETTDGSSGHKIMRSSDFFLNQGSAIPNSQEAFISLEMLLNGDSSIRIGSAEASDPLDPQDGVQRYSSLSGAEKTSLFNSLEIYKGLTFDSTGFGKTFKTACAWANDAPESKSPRVITQIDYEDAYSKVTHTMTESNVKSASVSLSTPYGGGEAEYKVEKEKSSSSSEITQYITGKYTVSKVALNIDPSDFCIDPAFEEAIADAANTHAPAEFQQYVSLLKVLNEYGYYVAQEFTLGGVLLSSDSSSVSEFSQTVSNKEEYGGSFKAAFNGIGGGASYNNASGSSATTTESNKFQITSFLQIGGKVGTSNDYDAWATSLDNAIYWNVASYDELYPTIALLSNIPLQNKCLQLMDKFYGYPAAIEIQPESGYACLCNRNTKPPTRFPYSVGIGIEEVLI